jgi:TRAP-type mannitol/chloroaromatic compound transport system substrate-binding protein
MSEFNSKNAVYLDKIISEGEVSLKSFPDSVLEKLRGYTDEVLEELAAENDDCRKIFHSFDKFRKGIANWSVIGEKNYYNKLMTS